MNDNDGEVIFFPCICGHSVEDHETRQSETGYTWNRIIFGCQHDKDYFKGMCSCAWYKQMNNLEYLEWLSETKSNIYPR